jgi:ankyrin repeat protein
MNFKSISLALMVLVAGQSGLAMEKEVNNDAIFEAIVRDDLDGVKECIKSGIDIDGRITPECIKKIGGEDDVCQGLTPIILACAAGKIQIVKWLLKNGADINKTTAHGVTSFAAAIADNRQEVVKLLIKKEANVNGKETKNTSPLGVAFFCEHIEIVKLLIDEGADVNERGFSGLVEGHSLTPFEHAIWRYRSIIDQYFSKQFAEQIIIAGADMRIFIPDSDTKLKLAYKNFCSDVLSKENLRRLHELKQSFQLQKQQKENALMQKRLKQLDSNRIANIPLKTYDSLRFNNGHGDLPQVRALIASASEKEGNDLRPIANSLLLCRAQKSYRDADDSKKLKARYISSLKPMEKLKEQRYFPTWCAARKTITGFFSAWSDLGNHTDLGDEIEELN